MRRTYFANKSVIDLNAIAVMGVSVKEGDSPIGYFGTGLKFAIATLLRTGHEVHLTVLDKERGMHERISFEARPEVIRGETFQRVHMLFHNRSRALDGGDVEEPLGFTTNLGRNWEPWMAYRELRSNCMDEGGTTADRLTDPPEGESWGTIFEVTGEAMAQCHADSGAIFIEGIPDYSHAECDVYEGRSDHAFYRGVRALDLPVMSLYRYNIRSAVTLTEDRSIKGEWEARYHIARALARCEDPDLLERVLTAQPHTFEKTIDFCGPGEVKPSDAFLEMVGRLRNSAHLNLSAMKLWAKYVDVGKQYTEALLDAYEEGQVSEALRLVRRLIPAATRADFIVLDGMGEGVLGMHRHGLCYVSRRALEKGVRHLASTIYEELVHKYEKLSDESRDLQDFLFDKLFMTVERLAAVTPDPPPVEERTTTTGRQYLGCDLRG